MPVFKPALQPIPLQLTLPGNADLMWCREVKAEPEADVAE